MAPDHGANSPSQFMNRSNRSNNGRADWPHFAQRLRGLYHLKTINLRGYVAPPQGSVRMVQVSADYGKSKHKQYAAISRGGGVSSTHVRRHLQY